MPHNTLLQERMVEKGSSPNMGKHRGVGPVEGGGGLRGRLVNHPASVTLTKRDTVVFEFSGRA